MLAEFPRTLRLCRRVDFDYVFSAPEQRSGDDYFIVLGRCHPDGIMNSRLGMVVAKRQISRAHERNRVKRIVREIFRQQARMPVYRDVVVLVKAPAKQASNTELFQSLAIHLRRMRR